MQGSVGVLVTVRNPENSKNHREHMFDWEYDHRTCFLPPTTPIVSHTVNYPHTYANQGCVQDTLTTKRLSRPV